MFGINGFDLKKNREGVAENVKNGMKFESRVGIKARLLPFLFLLIKPKTLTLEIATTTTLISPNFSCRYHLPLRLS